MPFGCISQLSLVLPADGSVNLSDEVLDFTWNPCESCSAYEIQFSTNWNFDTFTNQEIFETSISIDTIVGKYFWRVSGLNSMGEIIATSTIRQIEFIDLENMGNLQFWFDPNYGMTLGSSNKVLSWVSKSLNMYELTQSNINQSPIKIPNQIQEYSGIYFDGINNNTNGDYLSGGEVSLGSIFTVFRHHNNIQSVHSGLPSPNANPRFAICLGPPDGQYLHTYSSAFQNFKVNGIQTNQAPSNSWLLVSSTRNSSQNMSAYTISPLHSGYKRLKGCIMENIAFSNPLSEDDQILIENYLRYKYAPPVNLGHDRYVQYGFCETTISTTSSFENYLWSDGSTSNELNVTESGEYWVECTDIFGYTSRDTIRVNYPNYNPPENTVYCPNEVVGWNPINQAGYNFIWSDGSTEQENWIGTNGSYSVTIQDSLGCSITTNTFQFSEDDFPSSVSLGSDTSLCAGNTISFVSGFNESESFSWSDNSIQQSISILESGFYAIEATNYNGCIGQDTIQVTVMGTAPSLSYSIENEICQGSVLNFTENSTVPPGNTINQVIWNFGEVGSVFSSSGAQIYQDSGLYNGFLEISTLEGCSSKETFNIRVHPKPILSFSTANYCPYEEISFSATNSYDVPLESYQWKFGQNGNMSLDSNPSYSYGFSGNYDVELIAVDTNNCIDTVAQNVYVQPAPVADISILNPCEYTIWDLTDNSSIADTFEITTYEWNYGDGTDSINPVQGKYYENYGEYTVQLVLTGNNGCMDTSAQNLTVHPNPIINYQIGPACKNTWTEFIDLSTIPQGTLTGTDWLFNLQFEDNTTSTYFNFPTTGIQLVTLTSESDQGCVIDTTFTVDVNEELNANFNVDPEILVSDVPITFENTSIGADSSYWDFGDEGGINFNNNIENTITYSSLLNETYIDILLIAVNDFGCRDTISKTLLVNEAFYDINLKTLFAQDINGFLTVGVEIENLGTIPLENLNLTLKTPENGPIQENWSGSILQGESEIYIFNAQPSAFISDQDATERFVCVEAQNANISTYLDLNQENNINCKNIEGEGLVLLSMFPNPSDQDITISTLLSAAASLEIEFFDQRGRIVHKEITPELLKGIHSFNIPFSKFEKGVYTVRISDGESSLIYKMMRH